MFIKKYCIMTFRKEKYYTTVQQAKDQIPGYTDAFSSLEERVVLDRFSMLNSKQTLENYFLPLFYIHSHPGMSHTATI